MVKIGSYSGAFAQPREPARESWLRKRRTNSCYTQLLARWQSLCAGSRRYINDFHTNASVGADLLKGVGVPDESVQMVPSREMNRDRTYASAVALRNWFREHNMRVPSVNVLTENVHARRTQLLFEK